MLLQTSKSPNPNETRISKTTIDDLTINNVDQDLQNTGEEAWIAIATTTTDKVVAAMAIDLDHHLLGVGMAEEVLIGMIRDEEAVQEHRQDATRIWIIDLLSTMTALFQDEDLNRYLIYRLSRSSLQKGT